jgi:hypothetical protein
VFEQTEPFEKTAGRPSGKLAGNADRNAAATLEIEGSSVAG